MGDRKAEAVCRKFYKKSQYGRPSMAPGVNVAGFEARGEIDRRDFGINFEGSLENGSALQTLNICWNVLAFTTV